MNEFNVFELLFLGNILVEPLNSVINEGRNKYSRLDSLNGWNEDILLDGLKKKFFITETQSECSVEKWGGADHHYLTQILVWFGKWFITKIQRNKFMMELNGTLQKWTNIFRLHFLLWVRLQFYCPTIPLFRGTYVVIVEPWDNLLIEAQIWSPFTQLAILSDKIKLVAIQDLTGIHNCAWVWCPYKLWSIHDFKLSK